MWGWKSSLNNSNTNRSCGNIDVRCRCGTCRSHGPTAPGQGMGWDKLWQGAEGWNNPHLSLSFFFFLRMTGCRVRKGSRRVRGNLGHSIGGDYSPWPVQSRASLWLDPITWSDFSPLFLLPSAKFLHCVGNHLVWLIVMAYSSFSFVLYIGYIIPIIDHRHDHYWQKVNFILYIHNSRSF